MDHEGVGGFLESILAVMVVITASSVFLVVLSSGLLQVEESIDEEDVITWLTARGLYAEEGALPLDGLGSAQLPSDLPEGVSGLEIAYRLSGDRAPLITMGYGDAQQGDIRAFQLPLLIEMGGRNIPGVMEVRAWG